MPKGFWFQYFVKLNWNIPQVTSTVSSIWQMNQKPVGPFYDNFSEIPREISAIWLPRPRIGVTSKDGRRHFFFSKFVMNCDHRSDESGASIALKSLAERGRIFQVEKKKSAPNCRRLSRRRRFGWRRKTTHFTDNIPISMGNHQWGSERKNWQKKKRKFRE